jgi:predicted TIM-barrel fold metal-dependent hydrolase
VFERFPRLRIALSEGGAGWVPYALERSDKYFDINPGRTRLSRRPSEVFRDHVFVCIVTDDAAIDQLDVIGADNLMWESDFPHNDGMWPASRSTLERSVEYVADDVAVKIASTNAQRVFRHAFRGGPQELGERKSRT